MADRSGRLRALIHKNISDIIRYEVKKPGLELTSVNEVEVSKDHSHVYVYVSFLGAKHPEWNLKELNSLKGLIRSKLASKMDLRKVPDLAFYLDDRFIRAERVEAALRKEEEDLRDIGALEE